MRGAQYDVEWQCGMAVWNGNVEWRAALLLGGTTKGNVVHFQEDLGTTRGWSGGRTYFGLLTAFAAADRNRVKCTNSSRNTCLVIKHSAIPIVIEEPTPPKPDEVVVVEEKAPDDAVDDAAPKKVVRRKVIRKRVIKRKKVVKSGAAQSAAEESPKEAKPAQEGLQ